jgi:hypothetical protein
MAAMNRHNMHWIGLGIWSAVVAAGVVACGGGGGDGGGAGTANGSIRFAMTDAPACGYDHVWVTVEKISVNTNASASDTDPGWTDLAVSPPQRIDLLTLTNGVLQELGTLPLSAGHYSQVRLVLASNGNGVTPPANAVQPTGGNVTALTTPSGQQSGVKLQANVDVAAGQMVDLVLDFDACSSVVRAGNSGQYVLKPVVAVVPRIVSGIQGVVSTSLPLGSTTISAQQSGATVRSTRPDANGNWTIPFLQPGSYTVVITSDAHATGVITSVPASTATTVVNTSAAPITLPTSSMADVSGTVTASTQSNGTTVTSVVGDATLRALQSLTGGPIVEVARQAGDSTLGSYHFRLPQAAPVKGAFSSGTATLVLTPDTAVAGKYTIESTAPNRAALTKPADVSSASNVQLNFGY